MRLRKHLVAYFAFVVLIGLCAARLRAQAQDSQEAIEAMLLTTVEDKTAKSGEAVFAKVLNESQSADCPLIRIGALLKGYVVALRLRSNANPDIELALIFNQVECGRDLKATQMDLAGIQSASSAKTVSPFAVHGSVESLGKTATLDSSAESRGGADGSSAEAPAHKVHEPDVHERGLKVGVIRGIPGAHLDVATGPGRSSVLSTHSRHLRLERGALLLLLPSSAGDTETSGADPSDGPEGAPTDDSATSATSARLQGDVEDSCRPPACNLDESEPLARGSTTRIPIRQLGFLPRVVATVSDFDYDTAIAYLTQDEILVTFKARQLLPRSSRADDSIGNRYVRAAAIDVKTKRVLQLVQWLVPDHKQYLWQAGTGRVVVHVGDELRVYGAGLQLEHRILVGGPLNFFTIAPGGRSLAYGVVRERHSPELHKLVLTETRAEPEEDVEVKMLDANFEIQRTMMRSSRAMVPLLIDGGEILLRQQDQTHWAVVNHPWAEREKTLFRATSACKPDVNILTEDLILVAGCMESGAKWHVALRTDGKQILRRTSTANELMQHANADAGGNAFAIAAPRMPSGVFPGIYFRPVDLAGERLSVYNAHDGRLRFSTFVKTPAPSHQEFALSPNGDQLAVIEGGHISLIALPPK